MRFLAPSPCPSTFACSSLPPFLSSLLLSSSPSPSSLPPFLRTPTLTSNFTSSQSQARRAHQSAQEGAGPGHVESEYDEAAESHGKRRSRRAGEGEGVVRCVKGIRGREETEVGGKSFFVAVDFLSFPKSVVRNIVVFLRFSSSRSTRERRECEESTSDGRCDTKTQKEIGKKERKKRRYRTEN